MTDYIHWDSEDIESVLKMIQSDKHQIVPIIGSDVFYIEQGRSEISLHDYIFQEVVSSFVEPEFRERAFKECTGSPLRRMKKLHYCLQEWGIKKRNKRPSIYSCIAMLMQNIEFKDKIRLRDCVKDFLQYGNFPLIITTCYIDILEDILMAPHGKRYQPMGYYCQAVQDINDPQDNPIIFHLFGISESGTEPMITEDDFLKYLHFLHNSSAPHKLKDYLQMRTALTLGCNIPDWAFRFVLLSLMEKDGIIKERPTLLGGAVIQDIKKDQEFAEFLEEISYLPGDDIDTILMPINEKIYRPNLFLSYSAKENTSEWDGIQTILKKLEPFYKVWFFEEQSKKKYGERYWDLIKDGLEECDYFMAVVTSDMIERMKKVSPEGPIKDYDAGFLWEWKLMMDEQKKRQEQNKTKALCLGFFLHPVLPKLSEIINDPTLPLQFLRPIFEDNQNITDVSPSNFDPENITTSIK